MEPKKVCSPFSYSKYPYISVLVDFFERAIESILELGEAGRLVVESFEFAQVNVLDAVLPHDVQSF